MTITAEQMDYWRRLGERMKIGATVNEQEGGLAILALLLALQGRLSLGERTRETIKLWEIGKG